MTLSSQGIAGFESRKCEKISSVKLRIAFCNIQNSGINVQTLVRHLVDTSFYDFAKYEVHHIAVDYFVSNN